MIGLYMEDTSEKWSDLRNILEVELTRFGDTMSCERKGRVHRWLPNYCLW